MIEAAAKIKHWRDSPAQMVRDLFKVEPDVWQLEALEAFPNCSRLALKACAGPGKAQPVDLIIDTPDGKRRWGNIRPGDSVFAMDGSATKVRNVYQRGSLPIFRVLFDDGTSSLACGEHLWKVRGRTERRHFNLKATSKWTERSEKWCISQGYPLTPDDGYSVLSTEQIIERNKSPDGARRQFEIPTAGVVQYPTANQPLDPYVLGVWLGDGGRCTGRGSWRDAEIDQEIIRRGYNLKRSADGKSITVYGIRQKLKTIGIGDLGSPDRFIPDIYKLASPEQRMDILSGLMDTDGSIATDNNMSFDVTSERLVDDVAWLVRSLGGVAIRKKVKAASYRDKNTGERIICRPCHRLNVTLPFNPFFVGRKAERWREPQTRYLTRYIDSITPEGYAYCMCIEVEHASHCYLTNDFIVTHNTAVLAWIGWNFLLTRPFPYVAVTSITGDNLKGNLWTELARWYEKSPLLKATFKITGKTISAIQHEATWKLEAKTWAKDANPEQIGNSLAGVHADYVMWLLDESGDYPDSIMPTCESIFAGNPKEAHIVQAGNPTRRGGPLYKAFFSRGLWKIITITADPDDPKRTPRVSVEHARAQIAQYGRDNPWVKVKIFGEFPDTDFNALIGIEEVQAAMKRYYREMDIGNAPRVLGVDVARFGDDSSVIAPRQGIQCFPFIKHRNLTSTQGAGIVSRKWIEWKADAAFVDDTGGFGAGWIDQLRLLGRSPIGVPFSGQAHNKSRYVNKRAEMYFDAVEWIKRGGALCESPELAAALAQTTYTIQGDRLLLEPKEDVKDKIGFSPDDADAFVLTFAEPVTVQNRVAAPARHTVEYDPFSTGVANAVSSSYDPYSER